MKISGIIKTSLIIGISVIISVAVSEGNISNTVDCVAIGKRANWLNRLKKFKKGNTSRAFIRYLIFHTNLNTKEIKKCFKDYKRIK